MATLAVALAVAPPVLAQQRGTPQPELRRVVRPTATLAVAPAVIEPPPGIAAQVPASAVVLRPGNSATTLQSLRVTRQHALPALRTRPVVILQAGKVDFKPMLSNPRALFNVAQRLRDEPQLVQVTADETQVLEVDQGLVVRSFLGYRLHTGACSDRGRAARLANTGVRCFTQMTPQARAAAFANPADPHFVADPRQRANAVRMAEDKAVQVRAQVTGDIATLRKMLADPAQRASIDAEVGAAEAARLAALDDARLEAEVVNSGETRIEQVMFVPTRGSVDQARFGKLLNFGKAQPSGQSAAPTVETAMPPSQITQTLEPRVFLTGFTLGREYEWRQRVETSINWCVVGCKKTYYVELFAGFNYGFGLRFPVTVGGTYTNDNGTASLTTNFQTINGGPAEYAQAGLPAPQLFDGKELVAQVGAYAGVAFKVPIFGSNSARADLGKDFTEGLPAPFTNGQFRAPMPGENLPAMTKVFDDFDLAGGRANFGVVGGQIFPAIKAELHSDALRFTVHDNLNNQDTAVTSTGQVVPLTVNAEQVSDFTIGAPVYNLGFLVTPGINARLFIDIEVWSDHWDWPIWFPQLAVELPPGGMDFACHADTVCKRNYRIARTGAIETTGAGAAFLNQLDAETKAFDAEWLTQCADDICKTGIRLLRTDLSLFGKQTVETNGNANYAQVMGPRFEKANAAAPKLVHESQMRLTKKASKGWAILAQEFWSKRCSDLPCLDKVAVLADQMVVAANVLQLAKPNESSLAVQGVINTEYGAKFQAEIDASKARATQVTLLKMQQTTPVLFQGLPRKPR
ncbi:hypothetical protein [Lysobacter tyrosinilyticus]